MYLSDATDTESLGARLGAALRENADTAVPEGRIHLCGPLGAGKTTLVRGLARALGIEGPVKSPTYTLLEPYAHGEIKLYHFDLYRLSDGEELEYLGVRDVFAEPAVVVIEWPERAGNWLPAPDLTMDLRIAGRGREVHLSPDSARGDALVAILGGGRAL